MSGRLPKPMRFIAGSPSPKPGPSTDALLDELEAELDKAARQAGVGPEDPLWPVLQCWKTVIRATLQRAARSDEIVLAAVQRFDSQVDRLELQQNVNLEMLREVRQGAEIEMRRLFLRSAAELSATIGDDIAKANARRARVLDRNSILSTAVGLLMILAVTGAGCWAWGRSITTGEVSTVVGDVQLSLGNRLRDARALALLVERNPLAAELRNCLTGDSDTWKDRSNRYICAMPVYLDMPPTPQPAPSGTFQLPPISTAPTPASPPVWALPGRPPTGPVTIPSQP